MKELIQMLRDSIDTRNEVIRFISKSELLSDSLKKETIDGINREKANLIKEFKNKQSVRLL